MRIVNFISSRCKEKEPKKSSYSFIGGFSHTFLTTEKLDIQDTGFYAGLFLEKNL